MGRKPFPAFVFTACCSGEKIGIVGYKNENLLLFSHPCGKRKVECEKESGKILPRQRGKKRLKDRKVIDPEYF